MKTSLLIIGDELLNGRVSDQNGHFLSGWLHEQGIETESLEITKDSSQSIQNALKRMWPASDLILLTGGLGPTKDDQTKTVLSQFFNAPLKEDKIAAEQVQLQYQRIEKKWTPSLNSYHLIPTGFQAIKNPNGLAPGLLYQTEDKLLLCAPGVPRELKAMASEVWPFFIRKYFPSHLNQSQQIMIRTRGIPEETIFGELAPSLWEELEDFGKVSSLPQMGGVDIIISFKGDDDIREKNQSELKELMKKHELDSFIWQWGDLSLEELVIKKAKEKSITLSFAESCTGGLVSHRLTNISGSSAVFMGSAVTYSNKSKTTLLRVNEETLRSHGAVSVETAKEMALGSRNTYQSDIAISLTGIAGPLGGSTEKPVGTVAIGRSSKDLNDSKLYRFYGDRERLKMRFSEQALFQALKLIESYQA